MKLSSPIETIKKSINIFFDKKNMPLFVKLYLPLLPFALFSIWQSLYVKNLDQLKDPKMIGLVALINLTYLIVYLWIYMAGVMTIKQVIGMQNIEFREIYRNAWKMMWKFSLLSALLVLIIFFGGILFVFPAIILGVWYSFSKFIYIDEEIGILRSLGKSKNLATGNFWKLLGRYIVFGLFSGLAGILVSILPFGLGGIVTTLFGALFVLPYYLLYLELVKSYKS